MKDFILGATTSIISVGFGIIFQLYISESMNAKRSKIEIIKRSYDKRLDAYSQIYKMVSQCMGLYENILEVDVSKLERESYREALKSTKSCLEYYKENELFFSENILFSCEFLKMSYDYDVRNLYEVPIEYLLDMARQEISSICVLRESIKREIGLEEIDKMISGIQLSD